MYECACVMCFCVPVCLCVSLCKLVCTSECVCGECVSVNVCVHVSVCLTASLSACVSVWHECVCVCVCVFVCVCAIHSNLAAGIAGSWIRLTCLFLLGSQNRAALNQGTGEEGRVPGTS